MQTNGEIHHFGRGCNNISDIKADSNDGFTLRWLNAAYREQLALCDALEDIADSLPASVNRQQCIYAAKALGPAIRYQHLCEETVLFPWLSKRAGAGASLEDTLSRLKYEHFEDECFAEELTDALLKLGAGQPVNMEAIGYMLRGFFEGLRRHIAFERDHLLHDLPEDTRVARSQ